jgi:hypothetical protein
MFSARYRKQVSFDVWHELIVTHWRMFHGKVLRTGVLAQTGPGATLEIHLRGADEREYRARFTLIRLAGRWWMSIGPKRPAIRTPSERNANHITGHVDTG